MESKATRRTLLGSLTEGSPLDRSHQANKDGSIGNEEPGALVSPNNTSTNWMDDGTISDESWNGLPGVMFEKVMFVSERDC